MLTPNSPIRRLEYVVKQYDGTKNQFILPDVLTIALMSVGRDHEARSMNTLDLPIFRRWRGRGKEGVPEWYHHESGISQLIEWLDDRLPPTHEREIIMPWVARELGRLWKAVRKGNAAEDDYWDAVNTLEQKAPVIGMWASQANVDIGRVTLAEALEAVATFEADVDAGQVPQGITVMRFDDGYTIQSLVEEDQLSVEGEVMQHCVGGYYDEVRSGNAVIFSLRDPRGAPHATIEWRSEQHALGRDLQLDPMKLLEPKHESLREIKEEGRFVQIRGKQNDIPAEKYRPYIQAFIKKYFSSNPLAMLMVALPGQQIGFAGHTVVETDFGDDLTFGDVPIEQAKWAGGEFINCAWPELNGADFDGCTLGSCKFEGDVFDCSFGDVDAHDVEFMGGHIKDCIFDGSALSQTSFGLHREVEIDRCSFESVVWFNSAIASADIVNSDLVNSQLKFTALSNVTFRSCDMSGLEVDRHSSMNHVDLEQIDLSNVSYETVDRLLETMADDPQVAIESVQGEVDLPDGYEAYIQERLNANGR